MAQITQAQDAVTRGLLARGDTTGRHAAWLHEAARDWGQPTYSPAAAAVSKLAAEAPGGGAQTYAWALRACAWAATRGALPAACQALSNQRWAELAPDLVWPWLAMGGEARAAGDLSGFENAMHRASLASDWHNPLREFQTLARAQVPAQASDLDRAGALLPTLNAAVDVSLLVAQAAQYCPAQQDANRQQNCQRLARQMLARADNLVELRIALLVGARSGLTEAELAPGRADNAAIDRALTVPDPALVGERQACADHTRMLRRVVRLSEVGELQALREEAAKLPR